MIEEPDRQARILAERWIADDDQMAGSPQRQSKKIGLDYSGALGVDVEGQASGRQKAKKCAFTCTGLHEYRRVRAAQIVLCKLARKPIEKLLCDLVARIELVEKPSLLMAWERGPKRSIGRRAPKPLIGARSSTDVVGGIRIEREER